MNDPKKYLSVILKEYNMVNCDLKNKDNIKKLFVDLTLKDVVYAIENAKKINKENEITGEILYNYNGLIYYQNPDTKLYKFIEQVLKQCKCKI